MDLATRHLVPLMLILGRVSAFFAVLPIFGSPSMPVRVRAGLALILTVVFAMILPPAVDPAWDHPVGAGLALVREMLCGLALGLAVALVFAAIRQTGEIIRIQTGMAEAEIIDPMSGDEEQPLGMLLEMAVLVLFLVSGGHRLLLALIVRSYDVFPLGHPPSTAIMTDAILQAGALMLVYGLKLAAPLLAAFLLLAVVLAVLARALPEMNILLASLPLRVGLGLFMAAALVPTLGTFTQELGDWLSGFLAA